jgi:hypothetical protein
MSDSKTKVYHAIEPTFGFGPIPAWPDEYVMVAEVDSDEPDAVYELTNTTNHLWWENLGVHPAFVGEGVRSTSVGDVLIMPDGKILQCADIGWDNITDGRK